MADYAAVKAYKPGDTVEASGIYIAPPTIRRSTAIDTGKAIIPLGFGANSALCQPHALFALLWERSQRDD
jgi:hypothetical protein